MSITTLEHDWYPLPLPDNVVIGEGSWFHSTFGLGRFRSERRPAITIGRHTGVYAWSSFELGPDGVVEIGDHCTINEVMFATNGTVRIGSYSMLSYRTVIADGDFPLPGIGGGEGGEIVLGTNVWIGAGCLLLPGTHVGDGSVVAAKSVVRSQIPSGVLAAGDPAVVIRELA